MTEDLLRKIEKEFLKIYGEEEDKIPLEQCEIVESHDDEGYWLVHIGIPIWVHAFIERRGYFEGHVEVDGKKYRIDIEMP